MKNLNYTIGAKFNDTHNRLSNKVFDCVRASMLDQSFNIEEDIIIQILDRLKTQIYEKY
jgi:hypothetical protein